MFHKLFAFCSTTEHKKIYISLIAVFIVQKFHDALKKIWKTYTCTTTICCPLTEMNCIMY